MSTDRPDLVRDSQRNPERSAHAESDDRAPAEALVRLAMLAEPARAALHRLIRSREEGVTRDEAAAATGIARSLAAFHLDRLAEARLAEVTYERRSGRSGPGAGRPAKVYRRTIETIEASVPRRRYELAASLLAGAVSRHLAGGPGLQAAIDDAARAHGRVLGAAARQHAGVRASSARRLRAGFAVLEEAGFEPVLRGGNVVLRNCPFDALVATDRPLVCGMNRSLMAGVIEGLKLQGITAVFEPRPGACCIVWSPS